MGSTRATRRRSGRSMVITAAPQAGVDLEWLGSYAKDYLAAWNTHDADRLLGLMTDDIVYDDTAWPTQMRGHADVRAFLPIVGDDAPLAPRWGRVRVDSIAAVPAPILIRRAWEVNRPTAPGTASAVDELDVRPRCFATWLRRLRG